MTQGIPVCMSVAVWEDLECHEHIALILLRNPPALREFCDR